ncbi:MAG: SMP-30/gluconolactonase/LRE family protein [Bauldia litoralis]
MKFSVDTHDTVGDALSRPECVLCNRAGDIFASHLGHGIARIASDGTQSLIGHHAEVDGTAFVPNGFALLPDGGFLVANMGPAGGVWRLTANGGIAPFLVELEGKPLGATNFVMLDKDQRVWITVTTRHWPISDAFNPAVADGYIVVVDNDGARIARDGLTFTNEMRFDAAGLFAFVVETMARRISRLPVLDNGELGMPEIFAEFGHGTLPDGLAFDAEGHLWVTSLVSNRLIRADPTGSWEIVLEDCDPAQVDEVERLLAAGRLERDHMQVSSGTLLKNLSSLAFGGADLKTVYLGSLGGDRIVSFRSPVAGLPLAHWAF